MKKRFLSILLSLCMVLMLFPVTAFAEEPGRIDITLTGFELGNTPGDCKITSITTTGLGVEYSVDEVSLKWHICKPDGSLSPIDNNHVFEADISYVCTLYLDTKEVITSAPAVTVNGKIQNSVIPPSGAIIYITCSFDKLKLPTITINGPDEVCAQQDYEFTVTAPKGVTIVNSMYGNDYIGANVELTPNEDGTLSGVVHASSYSRFEGNFTLSVSGTVEG